jgi:nicotinamide-nucleotide amidase
MWDEAILSAARAVIASATAQQRMLATVESCTGGLVAAALTAVPGSSAVVERGFVTYSNAAKVSLVAVPAALIEAHGAVSAEVALAMAEGALSVAPVDLTVSITGVAGPGGGTATKPVGLVHFCAATRDGRRLPLESRYDPSLDRDVIRRAAVLDALALLDAALRA